MFDPQMMATQMATLFVQRPQVQLDIKNAQAKARKDALNDLQKSMQAFKTSLSDLTRKKSMMAMGASFSRETAGTVSATGQAQPGSYSLFVEQVASAHQVAYQNYSGVTAADGGKLTLGLAGEKDADGKPVTFDVELAGADRDGDGTVSVQEMALALNRAEGNSGKINAMVVNNNGVDQLVLSSSKTGEQNAISLTASGSATLESAFAGGNVLTEARDAIAWLGEKDSGVKMKQDTNTFTAIQGVSMTFTQAMKEGESLQLTVTRNDTDTKANVQSFIDAYNTLVKKLDEITASGNSESGKKAGPLANDSGIRSLKSKLSELVRTKYDGVSLTDMGISASRDGSLQLDGEKLEKALINNPAALDSFFSGADGKSGVLSQTTSYMDTWLKSTDGLLKRRKDNEGVQQKTLDKRQDAIDRQYDQAYKRYLNQYTQLQAMQMQMSQTLGMMDSYFSS